jgi:uncharacterized protein
MEKLIQYSNSMINSVEIKFKRYLRDKVNWENRLNIITGARGAGKTTMLLQYIRENLSENPDEVIYVSLDDLYFSQNTLLDFADDFVKRGGKHLFLDEIHKYKNWSQEIKNSYDYFPELKLVVTGSSALNIYQGKVDLSRRAISYSLNGLSFREFIELKSAQSLPVLALEEVLTNPSKPIQYILGKIKPIKLFEEYIQWGYYPFFTEGIPEYMIRLKQIVNHVLEVDLPSLENIDFHAVQKLRLLLSVIAEIVPFKPNIVKLSKQVGISRETLLRYLYFLEKADLLLLLQTDTFGVSKMNKPEKIYLNNPNLSYALTHGFVNSGNIRETFLFNQLKVAHEVLYSAAGDFLVDGKYTIEVGGKNKTRKQIAGTKHAFIASDNIEYSSTNKIPLWLFGFLY